jgi:hypothetical protein
MPIRTNCTAGATLLLAMSAIFAGGCRRAEVRTYVAPRDVEPEAASAGREEGEAPAAAAAAELPKVGWMVPDGWKDLGPDKTMNVGRFTAGDAMINVTPLASMDGQEPMLVNMWRNVLGQTALSDAEAAAQLKDVAIGSEKGRMFDLSAERNGEPVRIVTAFLHRGGKTWFFKLQGPPDAVAAQAAAFDTFLKSVQFTSGPTETAVPSEPATPSEPAAPSVPSSSEPAPAGWTAMEPGNMQAAKYALEGGAEVAVSIFPSDTGGLAANVLRWRRQLSLPEVPEAELVASARPIEGAGDGAVVVDLENGDRGLSGAVVPREGKWYFYKLTGPVAAVKAAREAFLNYAKAKKP